MALPYHIKCIIAERTGKTGTTDFFVNPGLTVAQYTEGAPGIATITDAMLAGRVNALKLGIPVDISFLAGNVAAGLSDVTDKGHFSFVSSENRPVEINIPSLDESFVADFSHDIDQSAPDVANFLTLVLDGSATPGGVIAPTNRGEDDITAVTVAREVWTSKGKRK
jgi:hypothetical protein